jgi:hypothetical protein
MRAVCKIQHAISKTLLELAVDKTNDVGTDGSNAVARK